MVTEASKAEQHVKLLLDWLASHPKETLKSPIDHEQLRILTGNSTEIERVLKRWQVLSDNSQIQEQLFDEKTQSQHKDYKGNIEGFIGTVKVPVGIAGPLLIYGVFAQGSFFIPLATTEAALVASYHRGIYLMNEAGGCKAALLNEGITRTPGFAFTTLEQAGYFIAWILEQQESLKQIAEATTQHGKLSNLKIALEGNHVYLVIEFSTGDAAGQNMVTIATQAMCQYILENTKIKPEYSFLEANLSGDKKASMQSFIGVRGKKVTAEIIIPGELIEKILHTTPKQMENYWRMSAIGGVLGGTMGVQGHYANGLAALYIATGQDVACVAESAVGVTRFEAKSDNSLYASVTLPNLVLGTVGGGTGLPSQNACLELMNLAGTGKARALAEVCAGLCLAGELSIIGALCAGEFSKAHQKLARNQT